jgi:hypothetical protein
MARPNALTVWNDGTVELPRECGDWSPDPDDETSSDDLVVRGAAVVHLERMSSTCYWLGITVGGKTVHIDITSKRRIKAKVRT